MRRFVPALAPAFAAALVACALGAGCHREAPAPPLAPLCDGCNLVVVSVDTLRADRVGAYGHDKATTPNIDRFAERSVLFEDAIAQSSWTRPSHLSMFTGLYPSEHGVVALADKHALHEDIPTLAGELAKRGYSTAGFTGGGNVSERFGFDRGFETYSSVGRTMTRNLDGARRWLAEHRTRKFFLFFHGYDAHHPYASDEEDRAAVGAPEASPRRVLTACRRATNERGAAKALAFYDAAVRRADRAVGGLLDAIEALGLADNTVVVVTSDHGEEFQEHGGCFHVRTLYREVLHVPLLVALPGSAPRRVGGAVPASVALASTSLELLGIDDHEIPGLSLASVVRGGPFVGVDVVSETRGKAGAPQSLGHQRAMTTDQLKFISFLDDSRGELYDRKADPAEKTPMAASPQGLALSERLAKWPAAHPARPQGKTASRLDSATERRLKALGYVD